MRNQDPHIGGLSSQERLFIAAVRHEGLSIITNETVKQNTGLSENAANQVLLRLNKKGWIQRVKRGHYILLDLTATSPEPIVEDALVLAMDLFSPCYLTGWTAAEHWGLTEQIFNTILVHSATYQRNSETKTGGVKFIVRRIKQEDLFGTKSIWSSNHKIEMADRHRTVVDILNRPEDGGGAELTYEICKSYLLSNDMNPTSILQYAERLGNRSVFKRLGFIVEHLVPSQVAFIEACHKRISKGVSCFDPSGPKTGRIHSRWNLRINFALGDS